MKPPARKITNWRPTRGPDPAQSTLFEIGEDWLKTWGGMPEFTVGDIEPYKNLLIHFMSQTDFKQFCEVIGQVISDEARAIYFPKLEFDKVAHLRWVDAKSQGSTTQHYFEWQRKAGVNLEHVPQELPPDVEAQVLAYESLKELLEDQ